MARLPRLVVPGYPHHVTQRGNRRQQTFFSRADFKAYIDYVANAKAAAGVELWAYCLMPNHIHMVAVPETDAGLSELFREAHRRYTCRINIRERWQGHLWQGRFHSCVMDEHHLLAAIRYIELNPVRAGICRDAAAWPWSSARAHLRGVDDALVNVAPMLQRVDDWRAYLGGSSPVPPQSIVQHTRTGRPLGDDAFIEQLERITGRRLTKRKRGPKKVNCPRN